MKSVITFADHSVVKARRKLVATVEDAAAVDLLNVKARSNRARLEFTRKPPAMIDPMARARAVAAIFPEE